MNGGVVAEDVEQILEQRTAWRRLAGRRFLVTGSTGMVGQYLVRSLLALGRSGEPTHVVAATRRAAAAAELFAPELASGRLEILDHDPVRPLPPLQPLDYIIHAASPANPVSFRNDPVGVIAANVEGTTRLLAAARDHGAVFCLLSTAEIYGQALGCGDRLGEASPGVLDSLDPRSAYPESKRLAEALCVAHEHQHSTAYRIARLAHTYGPGMPLDDPRVQAYVMRQALAGEDIVLQSDGQARRTYTYVSDAVCGLLYLLDSPRSLACNIANENAMVSIADLARAVLRCCRGSGATLKLLGKSEATLTTVAPPALDCARLRALGWAPRIDLETGLRRTLRHHRAVLAAA